jgi:hypothetical protein
MALPPGITAIPTYMYYSGLGAVALVFILIFLIMWLSMKTPMMTWLSAIIKRSPIFLMTGRDNIGGFFNSSKKASQWSEIKKKGLFFMSEGSYILDRKSKLPIYLAHSEIGATINLTWPQILDKMIEKNFMIKDGNDYQAIVLNKKLNEGILEYARGKTIKISDLQQFFPLNINPSFIKSVVENEKRKAQKRQENMKILLFAGLAFMMIAIGGYMLLGRLKEAKTTCSCNCGDQPSATPGIVKINSTPNMPELISNNRSGSPAVILT